MNKNYFILLIVLLLFYHCGNDNPLTIDPPVQSDYLKIFTTESGSNKFEVYSTSGTNFVYGYNNLGFKVFVNNTEQNLGFVKFKPTMYHGIGGPSHSVPVPEKYYYDPDKSMYTGYAVFIMYDTAAFWAADFSCNDTYNADSSIIDLRYSSLTKIAGWDNSITERTYFLTLISPSAPVVGLNDMDVMLHETSDMINYLEINNAEMFIRPWMETMGHGTSNNIDPTWISNGRYKGTVNFNMPGEWFLYDSIKVNGSFITPTPAPKFILQVN